MPATGRKPGKQPGTQGFSLGLVDDPDMVVDHVPDACGRCGSDLDTAANASICGDSASARNYTSGE